MEEIQIVDTPPALPPRLRDAHKGDFGRVLVIGGCRAMPGAAALAVNAALRGGAGLVTFAAPEVAQPIIAGLCPCATSAPLACDEAGDLHADAVEQLAEPVRRADVLAVGPGFAVGEPQAAVVRLALSQPCALVLDADGLNNLALIPDWPALRRGPLVLTPHPGEFARLTGGGTPESRADRLQAAASAAREWMAAGGAQGQLVCVLKGAGTVVTDGDVAFVGVAGNPGMATGGSGDVLTGLIAGLIAQGLSPFGAACLAVRCHGRAGDLAAKAVGEVSLIATDLLEHLPAAMMENATAEPEGWAD